MTARVLKQDQNTEQVKKIKIKNKIKNKTKTLVIRTKHNMRIFGVTPFIKLLCPVLDCSKLTLKKISGLAVHLISTVFHRLAVKRRFVT